MQASQHEWDEGWSCASCHHQYLPAIAFQAARQHGIPVDEKIARTDAGMAFPGLSHLDAVVEASRAIEPSIGEAYKLWAADASGFGNNLAIQASVRMMAGRQFPDGHWATMDQRPPQSYSPFTATALAIRSLRRYSYPAEARDRKSARGPRAPVAPRQPAGGHGGARVPASAGLAWAGAPQGELEPSRRVLWAYAASRRRMEFDSGFWSGERCLLNG